MPIASERSGASLQTASPCNLSKSEIEKLAESSAKELGFTPGGDIAELIQGLGGTIEYVDADRWLATESGSIEVYGPKRFTIYLSRFTSGVRDRFTLAHELGHYVLHADSGGKPIRVARHGSNRVEWEANWFAAGFLMPRREFQAAFEKQQDPIALAATFDVSIAAAKIRIESLGLS